MAKRTKKIRAQEFSSRESDFTLTPEQRQHLADTAAAVRQRLAALLDVMGSISERSKLLDGDGMSGSVPSMLLDQSSAPFIHPCSPTRH